MEQYEITLSQIVKEDSCVMCGACCAHFRVSFYWAEGEQIPDHMLQPLNAVYACMQGTNQKNPRCMALQGTVGEHVSCGIYPSRSSACKEVQAGDPQCNKARHAHGLIALIELESTLASNDDGYDQVV